MQFAENNLILFKNELDNFFKFMKEKYKDNNVSYT